MHSENSTAQTRGDLQIHRSNEAPPLKSTDIRLTGPKAAFDKLGREGLDSLNRRLRGSRQQRRAAAREVKKHGLRIETGADYRSAAPKAPLLVSNDEPACAEVPAL